jgi:hypothetical protein
MAISKPASEAAAADLRAQDGDARENLPVLGRSGFGSATREPWTERYMLIAGVVHGGLFEPRPS